MAKNMKYAGGEAINQSQYTRKPGICLAAAGWRGASVARRRRLESGWRWRQPRRLAHRHQPKIRRKMAKISGVAAGVMAAWRNMQLAYRRRGAAIGGYISLEIASAAALGGWLALAQHLASRYGVARCLSALAYASARINARFARVGYRFAFETSALQRASMPWQRRSREEAR